MVTWDFLRLRSVVKKVANLDSIHYNLGMAPCEDAGDHQDYEPCLVGNPHGDHT